MDAEDEAPEAAADSAVAHLSDDPVVLLCELVCVELIRLGCPGSAMLDTSAGPVRAYAAELCKVRHMAWRRAGALDYLVWRDLGWRVLL